METMEKDMNKMKKRCHEAEEAAKFYKDRYQRVESINSICAQHDAAVLMNPKAKMDEIKCVGFRGRSVYREDEVIWDDDKCFATKLHCFRRTKNVS